MFRGKKETDSMYPLYKLCSQNNFWVVCWNVKELQIKKNNVEIMHTSWVEVTKKAMQNAKSKRNKEKEEPYAFLHEDLLPLL